MWIRCGMFIVQFQSESLELDDDDDPLLNPLCPLCLNALLAAYPPTPTAPMGRPYLAAFLAAFLAFLSCFPWPIIPPIIIPPCPPWPPIPRADAAMAPLLPRAPLARAFPA